MSSLTSFVRIRSFGWIGSQCHGRRTILAAMVVFAAEPYCVVIACCRVIILKPDRLCDVVTGRNPSSSFRRRLWSTSYTILTMGIELPSPVPPTSLMEPSSYG
ncbi:hypothetical protein Hanom_Chr12g01066811 [Helianthus anomalus]